MNTLDVQEALSAVLTLQRIKAFHKKVERDGPTQYCCSKCVAGYYPATGELAYCAWPCPTAEMLGED